MYSEATHFEDGVIVPLLRRLGCNHEMELSLYFNE